MLDSISVSHREREVVPPGLRVSDQESPVLILTQQELLLGLKSLYLSKVPPGRQKINCTQFASNYNNKYDSKEYKKFLFVKYLSSIIGLNLFHSS